MAHYTDETIETRSFIRWGQQAWGWYNSAHELKSRPGVFVVGTKLFLLPMVIDVGDAEDIRHAVAHHARARFWKRNAPGGLLYAAVYTDAQRNEFLNKFTRQTIAAHIRSVEQPVCGVRDLLECRPI